MEERPNILVVGYGTVGTRVYNELCSEEGSLYGCIGAYDPAKYMTNRLFNADFMFICVDTPILDGKIDLSQVETAIQDNKPYLKKDGVMVIKSTVLPGTTDYLKEKYGIRIIHSPEYYGATQHCNNYDFNFTILGGDEDSCVKVQQLLQELHDSRHKFYITDAKTAELTKYMENAYLATMVSFCTQFYEIAEQAGVKYEKLRELFTLDPRVGGHTFVYRDRPYWKSHCLDKDVPTIANAYNAEFLLDMIKFNDKQKEKYEQNSK